MAAPPLQLRNPSPKTRYAHTQRQRNKIDLGNQSYALQLDVVNFRSANFRSLNAHLRIANNTPTGHWTLRMQRISLSEKPSHFPHCFARTCRAGKTPTQLSYGAYDHTCQLGRVSLHLINESAIHSAFDDHLLTIDEKRHGSPGRVRQSP